MQKKKWLKSSFKYRKKLSKNKIAGFHDGYFNRIRRNKKKYQVQCPDLVFVALGFPKQEIWIYENLKDLIKGFLWGLGEVLMYWLER